MTKITIHGQKMQFHKKVAISVSLVQPTPYGTLTYTPAPGQPGLSSLPVGAQIVESNGDYLIKHNNVTIGEVEAVAASGYEFKNMVLWKDSGASITISTTPITLDDSDGITAIFIMSTISVTTSCGTGGTIDVQLASGYSLSELPPGTTIARDTYSSVTFYLNYGGQSICTIKAYGEVERGYDLEGCTINRGGKMPVSTTPIELENGDVIGFTFEQVNTVLWFYSDAVGQWYDSNNNIVSSAKLPVGLYVISSFTQATSNSYALTISGNSTYTYYYKWSSLITVDYIEINGSQTSIPYPIVSGDYLRVIYTEIPGVSLASETGLGHWEDMNGNEISFIPAQSGRTSIDFSVYDYDSYGHYVKIRIEGGSTSEYNSSYIVYCCSEDNHLTDVEITDLYEDYNGTRIYGTGGSHFYIPTGYYLIGNMSPIYGVIEKGKQSSSNILQDVANNVSCLSAQQYWEIQPYQPNYLFFSKETLYYCGIFSTQQQQNSGFAAVVFDPNGYVYTSDCFSYNSNPFGITDFAFLNRESSMMSSGSPMDYRSLQSNNIKLYSNTQLVQLIMEYFHIR